MEKEKVIKGLELCEIGSGDRCYETECPYYGQGCTESLKNDILELLKEQEAVEPKTEHWIYKKYDDMFMCSSCEKYSIRNDYPYCHWCGAKMEGR